MTKFNLFLIQRAFRLYTLYY